MYRDPVHDGPTDPLLVWNRQESAWWLVYTQRRALSAAPDLKHSWVHGTDLGVASSTDGREWLYRGTLNLQPFEPGRNTYWAPEIVEHDGTYHMYVSFVRGIPDDWVGDRAIVHYSSTDLWNWTLKGEVPLSSRRVIDADVARIGERWLMHYKDEGHESLIYVAESRDLHHWTVLGPAVTDRHQEGPAVFLLAGAYWMVTDPWNGLGVYRSDNGLDWSFQGLILDAPGTRPLDQGLAHHASVHLSGDRALIAYFVHPFDPASPRSRSSVVQFAELRVREGRLVCDRDRPFEFPQGGL